MDKYDKNDAASRLKTAEKKADAASKLKVNKSNISSKKSTLNESKRRVEMANHLDNAKRLMQKDGVSAYDNTPASVRVKDAMLTANQSYGNSMLEKLNSNSEKQLQFNNTLIELQQKQVGYLASIADYIGTLAKKTVLEENNSDDEREYKREISNLAKLLASNDLGAAAMELSKNTLGKADSGGMLSLVGSLFDAIKSQVEGGEFKTIIKSTIKDKMLSILPSSYRKSLEVYKEDAGGFFQNMLNKLAYDRDQSIRSIMEGFKKHTGLNYTVAEKKTDYTKAATLDLKMYKSVTEIIPEYLSQIVGVLKKQEDRLFDWDNDRWTTRTQLANATTAENDRNNIDDILLRTSQEVLEKMTETFEEDVESLSKIFEMEINAYGETIIKKDANNKYIAKNNKLFNKVVEKLVTSFGGGTSLEFLMGDINPVLVAKDLGFKESEIMDAANIISQYRHAMITEYKLNGMEGLSEYFIGEDAQDYANMAAAGQIKTGNKYLNALSEEVQERYKEIYEKVKRGELKNSTLDPRTLTIDALNRSSVSTFDDESHKTLNFIIPEYLYKIWQSIGSNGFAGGKNKGGGPTGGGPNNPLHGGYVGIRSAQTKFDELNKKLNDAKVETEENRKDNNAGGYSSDQMSAMNQRQDAWVRGERMQESDKSETKYYKDLEKFASYMVDDEGRRVNDAEDILKTAQRAIDRQSSPEDAKRINEARLRSEVFARRYEYACRLFNALEHAGMTATAMAAKEGKPPAEYIAKGYIGKPTDLLPAIDNSLNLKPSKLLQFNISSLSIQDIQQMQKEHNDSMYSRMSGRGFMGRINNTLASMYKSKKIGGKMLGGVGGGVMGALIGQIMRDQGIVSSANAPIIMSTIMAGLGITGTTQKYLDAMYGPFSDMKVGGSEFTQKQIAMAKIAQMSMRAGAGAAVGGTIYKMMSRLGPVGKVLGLAGGLVGGITAGAAAPAVMKILNDKVFNPESKSDNKFFKWVGGFLRRNKLFQQFTAKHFGGEAAQLALTLDSCIIKLRENMASEPDAFRRNAMEKQIMEVQKLREECMKLETDEDENADKKLPQIWEKLRKILANQPAAMKFVEEEFKTNMERASNNSETLAVDEDLASIEELREAQAEELTKEKKEFDERYQDPVKAREESKRQEYEGFKEYKRHEYKESIKDEDERRNFAIIDDYIRRVDAIKTSTELSDSDKYKMRKELDTAFAKEQGMSPHEFINKHKLRTHVETMKEIDDYFKKNKDIGSVTDNSSRYRKDFREFKKKTFEDARDRYYTNKDGVKKETYTNEETAHFRANNIIERVKNGYAVKKDIISLDGLELDEVTNPENLKALFSHDRDKEDFEEMVNLMNEKNFDPKVKEQIFRELLNSLKNLRNYHRTNWGGNALDEMEDFRDEQLDRLDEALESSKEQMSELFDGMSDSEFSDQIEKKIQRLPLLIDELNKTTDQDKANKIREEIASHFYDIISDDKDADLFESLSMRIQSYNNIQSIIKHMDDTVRAKTNGRFGYRDWFGDEIEKKLKKYNRGRNFSEKVFKFFNSMNPEREIENSEIEKFKNYNSILSRTYDITKAFLDEGHDVRKHTQVFQDKRWQTNIDKNDILNDRIKVQMERMRKIYEDETGIGNESGAGLFDNIKNTFSKWLNKKDFKMSDLTTKIGNVPAKSIGCSIATMNNALVHLGLLPLSEATLSRIANKYIDRNGVHMDFFNEISQKLFGNSTMIIKDLSIQLLLDMNIRSSDRSGAFIALIDNNMGGGHYILIKDVKKDFTTIIDPQGSGRASQMSTAELVVSLQAIIWIRSDDRRSWQGSLDAYEESEHDFKEKGTIESGSGSTTLRLLRRIKYGDKKSKYVIPEARAMSPDWLTRFEQIADVPLSLLGRLSAGIINTSVDAAGKAVDVGNKVSQEAWLMAMQLITSANSKRHALSLKRMMSKIPGMEQVATAINQLINDPETDKSYTESNEMEDNIKKIAENTSGKSDTEDETFLGKLKTAIKTDFDKVKSFFGGDKNKPSKLWTALPIIGAMLSSDVAARSYNLLKFNFGDLKHDLIDNFRLGSRDVVEDDEGNVIQKGKYVDYARMVNSVRDFRAMQTVTDNAFKFAKKGVSSFYNVLPKGVQNAIVAGTKTRIGGLTTRMSKGLIGASEKMLSFGSYKSFADITRKSSSLGGTFISAVTKAANFLYNLLFKNKATAKVLSVLGKSEIIKVIGEGIKKVCDWLVSKSSSIVDMAKQTKVGAGVARGLAFVGTAITTVVGTTAFVQGFKHADVILNIDSKRHTISPTIRAMTGLAKLLYEVLPDLIGQTMSTAIGVATAGVGLLVAAAIPFVLRKFIKFDWLIETIGLKGKLAEMVRGKSSGKSNEEKVLDEVEEQVKEEDKQVERQQRDNERKAESVGDSPTLTITSASLLQEEDSTQEEITTATFRDRFMKTGTKFMGAVQSFVYDGGSLGERVERFLDIAKSDNDMSVNKFVSTKTNNMEIRMSGDKAQEGIINGIIMNVAYEEAIKYSGKVKYNMGSKNPRAGSVDCSGWTNWILTQIKTKMKENGIDISSEYNLLWNKWSGGYGAAGQLQFCNIVSGLVMDNIRTEMLKPGMLIGFRSKSGVARVADRPFRINHVAMVIFDKNTNQLVITESVTKTGVRVVGLKQIEAWLNRYHLYIGDPFAPWRSVDKNFKAMDPNPAASVGQSYDGVMNERKGLFEGRVDATGFKDAGLGIDGVAGAGGGPSIDWSKVDTAGIDVSGIKFTGDANKNKRAQVMAGFFLKHAPRFGVDPSIALAQWSYESGWGESVTGDYNMFGIKAHGSPNQYWKGNKKYCDTTEYYNGVKMKTKAWFRSYDTMENAVLDYLSMHGRKYSGVTPNNVAALKQYATDVRYIQKIQPQAQKFERLFKSAGESKGLFSGAVINTVSQKDVTEANTKPNITITPNDNSIQVAKNTNIDVKQSTGSPSIANAFLNNPKKDNTNGLISKTLSKPVTSAESVHTSMPKHTTTPTSTVVTGKPDTNTKRTTSTAKTKVETNTTTPVINNIVGGNNGQELVVAAINMLIKAVNEGANKTVAAINNDKYRNLKEGMSVAMMR